MNEPKTIADVGAFAVESMLCEVAATPKPGLVDRENNGAHTDMDFFTFLVSASALHDTFDRMAQTGWEQGTQPLETLLPKLREIGKAAE